MALIIVTRNQYVVASRINSIVLDESYDYKDVRRRNGQYASVKDYNYRITIDYVADNPNSSSMGREDVRECVVAIQKKVDAYRIYKDLINQIRDQMPDALFLDRAMESLLADGRFDIAEESDAGRIYEYDEKPAKVRGTRKAKRKR